MPVFGDLWSQWYKPMVEACIKGLTKLAGLMESKDRELVIGIWNVEGGGVARDPNGAPVIPPQYIAKGDFPGGQPVFSYMWCLREGRQPPAMDDAVHDFFYKNRNLLNAANGGKDELDYNFHLFAKNRLIGLDGWLSRHWSDVWSMLYGRYARDVPH